MLLQREKKLNNIKKDISVFLPPQRQSSKLLLEKMPFIQKTNPISIKGNKSKIEFISSLYDNQVKGLKHFLNITISTK